MAVRVLSEIEASIDQLELDDQIRLLQYLTPKVTVAVLSARVSAPDCSDAAWRRYRAIGERLAATSVPGEASLTDAVCDSRR